MERIGKLLLMLAVAAMMTSAASAGRVVYDATGDAFGWLGGGGTTGFYIKPGQSAGDVDSDGINDIVWSNPGTSVLATMDDAENQFWAVLQDPEDTAGLAPKYWEDEAVITILASAANIGGFGGGGPTVTVQLEQRGLNPGVYPDGKQNVFSKDTTVPNSGNQEVVQVTVDITSWETLFMPGNSFIKVNPNMASMTADTDTLGTLQIDRVTMEYIPEPATMALMGLGGLVALARRRR